MADATEVPHPVRGRPIQVLALKAKCTTGQVQKFVEERPLKWGANISFGSFVLGNENLRPAE